MTGAVHIHYPRNKQSSPERLLMALSCVLLLFTGNGKPIFFADFLLISTGFCNSWIIFLGNSVFNLQSGDS